MNLTLKKEIASNSNADMDDIIPLKETLSKFGAYDTPEYGINQYPDQQMIDGIKMYQAKNNLTVDGIMKPDGETINSINNETSNNKPSYMKFDGQKATWMEDGKEAQSWPAMSGRDGYQCKKDENIKNKGPIPEGKWIMRQDRHENYDKDATWYDSTLGSWRGGKDAWGNDRVWIEPTNGTNNMNRTGLSVHGGKNLGSAGCIDLADKMPELINKFKKYGKDVIVDVKYPKDCW